MSSSLFEQARHNELGAFLRSRRERLQPVDLGLPHRPRRRTPGLRREEVAELAGIGGTWYTWLEQGRDVRPSSAVLLALAEALRLDSVERRHLFVLAGRTPPDEPVPSRQTVAPSILRVLEALRTQPAYVLSWRWDVLAWNRAAAAVFGDYGALEGDARNILHLLFADVAHRRLLTDWPAIASASLAMFRAASARHVGDPDFERLVTLLLRASAEFREWWPARELHRRLVGHKRVEHPTAGRLIFEHASLAVDDGSEMTLVIYTPLAEEKTDLKLGALLASNASSGGQ